MEQQIQQHFTDSNEQGKLLYISVIQVVSNENTIIVKFKAIVRYARAQRLNVDPQTPAHFTDSYTMSFESTLT